MTSITDRFIRGIEGIIESVPMTEAIIFGGFIYAKLSDLPANLVVKAWAIWQVAHTAFVTLAIICINDSVSRRIAVSVISILTTGIGIYELQKRNLIGYKMAMFIAAIKLIEIFLRLKNPNSEFESQLNQWIDDEGGQAGEAAERIREAFEKGQETLDLGWFNLKTLPPCIDKLVNLKELNLGYNQLSTLPSEIGSLVNLECLYLHKNQLTSISSQIGRLSNLQDLYVHRNPDLDDLPLSLGQCSLLVTLYTDQTKIPNDRVRTILAVCRSARDKNALTILPSQIEAWQKVAGTSFDLKFITDTELDELNLTDKDKIDIREWLLRLERTYDFSAKSQKELAKTVCAMLKSLQDFSSFKESFFAQISSNLEGCGDRSAMAFNELYLTWKLDTLDPSTAEKDKLSLMVQAAKTAALHKALQKRIEEEKSKTKVDVNESVEIYLYYEIQLTRTLNLLSFITGMLYGDIGKRSWIDENDLIKEVNNTYLDEMIYFSSLIALRDEDKSFTSTWKTFQEKFGERLEEIENQNDALSSQEYLEKIDALQIERTAAEYQQTLQWIQDKLTKNNII